MLLAACALSCSSQPPAAIERVDPPAAAGALAPNLSLDGRAVWLSWLEPDAAGYALKLARFDDGAWGMASTVARGARFFANDADVPSVVRGPDGALVAHWLAKSGLGTHAYDVQLARSRDDGATWQALGTAHDDGTQTEHGFVSLLATAEGVRAFWLDGRAMGVSGEEGSMTLRTALIGSAVSARELLDDRVCECCQTSAALTSEGPVLVYRNRSASELRDPWIVRREPNGWSSPAPVHEDGWEMLGCPVNGPAVASDGERTLAVVWFTGQGNHPRVQIAFSRDAGASFGPPAVVDEARPAGRVGAVLTDTGDAIVSWVAPRRQGEGAELRVARVAPDGRVGAPLVISASLGAAVRGLPRLVRRGDALVIAWISAEAESRVRAVTLPVRHVPATPGARR